MSARVLLNLLNKLRKRDKMPGLLSISFATSLINSCSHLILCMFFMLFCCLLIFSKSIFFKSNILLYLV